MGRAVAGAGAGDTTAADDGRQFALKTARCKRYEWLRLTSSPPVGKTNQQLIHQSHTYLFSQAATAAHVPLQPMLLASVVGVGGLDPKGSVDPSSR